MRRFVAAVILFAALPAAAQRDTPENQLLIELLDKVEHLQTELNELRDRNDRLQHELEKLKREFNGAAAPAPETGAPDAAPSPDAAPPDTASPQRATPPGAVSPDTAPPPDAAPSPDTAPPGIAPPPDTAPSDAVPSPDTAPPGIVPPPDAAPPDTAPSDAVPPGTAPSPPVRRDQPPVHGEEEYRRYRAAWSALNDKDYVRLREGFGEFLERYPHGKYAASAKYWIGESWYAQRDFGKAETAFRRVVEEHADHQKSEDASVKIAIIRMERGEHDAAREILDSLAESATQRSVRDLARKKLKLLKKR
ncbi:MAG: tetratricopeptide repeat protein [Gammaproteobacteria bacterium]|nr:tetratricopeptide repeat protein [Gammaproteobacteria bacterium]